MALRCPTKHSEIRQMLTEAHTWTDGSLGEQDWTPPARYFLSQAAERHQTAVGGIKHVAGNHLTMDHT